MIKEYQAKRATFPSELLDDWDRTCQKLNGTVKKQENTKKSFSDMTNLEVAEYIVNELILHSAKEKETKINVVQKALIDLKRSDTA